MGRTGLSVEELHRSRCWAAGQPASPTGDRRRWSPTSSPRCSRSASTGWLWAMRTSTITSSCATIPSRATTLQASSAPPLHTKIDPCEKWGLAAAPPAAAPAEAFEGRARGACTASSGFSRISKASSGGAFGNDLLHVSSHSSPHGIPDRRAANLLSTGVTPSLPVYALENAVLKPTSIEQRHKERQPKRRDGTIEE